MRNKDEMLVSYGLGVALMRKSMLFVLVLALILNSAFCLGVAEDLPDYSLDAADQFCYIWNNFYIQNGLDYRCGYLRTDDNSHIDSFSVTYNGSNLNTSYKSGIIPSTAWLYFVYDPQEHYYGFCAFTEKKEMKSDLEKASIYMDDGVINDLMIGSSHDPNDMWSITLQADDVVNLMNCDQFTIKLTIDGKNEIIDITRDEYDYLYEMLYLLAKFQLYTDMNYYKYYSAEFLPGGIRSTPTPEPMSTETYSFRKDLDAIDEAAKSVFYIEIQDDLKRETGSASGFVAFNEHLFVTNQHVIQDASFLKIEGEDGRQYLLDKVVMSDKEHDIAILLFPEGVNYQSLEMSPENNLKRGQPVVTIGNPIGYKGTVSYGNISAFPIIADYGNTECIQFTAPTSHGSSGGCLFDDNGILIGVTSAIGVDYYSGKEGNDIGIAVPINIVQELYNKWDKISYETLGTNKSWDTVGYKDLIAIEHCYVGQVVKFGHYEADNNIQNGKEPIEWIIFKKDEKSGFVGLISRYVIDAVTYNKKDDTWSNSNIREWLNNRFYLESFDESEKKDIWISSISGIGNDKKTDDRIFLLKSSAIDNYFPKGHIDRIGIPTEYAKVSNALIVSSQGSVEWRTRDSSVMIDKYGEQKDIDKLKAIGIRPALHVQLTTLVTLVK